jgi:hypothetical protein
MEDMKPTAGINPLGGAQTITFEVFVDLDAPRVEPAELIYQLMAGSYGAGAESGVLIINPIIETFENQNFSSFPWVMNGNKPWIISATNPYSGTYCSRSGGISHNQKSVMDLTLNVSKAGNISFARKISCEIEFDFLRFSIDGVEMERWSGSIPWGEVSYPITAGLHTFSWSYEKDALSSAGQDRVWVDEILLPPHEIVVGTGNPAITAFTAAVLPNPTPGPAWLSLTIPEERRLEIDVYNCLGRLIRKENPGALPAGKYMQSIDLSDQLPGMYWLHVKTGNGQSVMLKLIKT